MKLNVHIERLVLDGWPLEPAQAAQMEAALAAQLALQLGRGPPPAWLRQGAALPALRGAPVRIDAAGGAPLLGAQIATAVQGSLARGPGTTQ